MHNLQVLAQDVDENSMQGNIHVIEVNEPVSARSSVDPCDISVSQQFFNELPHKSRKSSLDSVKLRGAGYCQPYSKCPGTAVPHIIRINTVPHDSR